MHYEDERALWLLLGDQLSALVELTAPLHPTLSLCPFALCDLTAAVCGSCAHHDHDKPVLLEPWCHSLARGFRLTPESTPRAPLNWALQAVGGLKRLSVLNKENEESECGVAELIVALAEHVEDAAPCVEHPAGNTPLRLNTVIQALGGVTAHHRECRQLITAVVRGVTTSIAASSQEKRHCGKGEIEAAGLLVDQLIEEVNKDGDEDSELVNMLKEFNLLLCRTYQQ